MKFWLLTMMLLAGFAQAQAAGETIRICDASGCTEQARSASTFNPNANVSTNPEADRRLAALVAMAEQDPRAAFDLGLRYFRGDGVAQNSHQALQWMRSAGERGDLRAQSALGRFYLAGLEEMGSDPVEAVRWLALAAGRGDKEARKLLNEAVTARKNEREADRVSEDRRKNGIAGWYTVYPYHLAWRPSGWYHR